VAGGALQTLRGYGGRLMGKLKGQRELTVDDNVLRLLALRQQQLLAVLTRRGHAALERIEVSLPAEQTQWREGTLPESLKKARAHPQWSSLNPRARLSDGERLEALENLLQHL
jgi:hypothetical protein